MKRRLYASFFTALNILLAANNSLAGEWQSLDDIVMAVDRFVHEKTADINGEVSVSVTRPDARLHLGKCDTMEAWLPTGSKLWGRATVGVRCRTPASWSLYVPVTVKITGNALVAARPIARGEILDAQAVQPEKRELTQYRGGVLTSPEQIIGKTAAANIAVGEPLRPELLRAALIIRQGQQVTLVAQGVGFRVSSEGVAMGNAATGQVVAVKTRSGQIIKGIAKSEGIVEVYF